MVSVPHARRGFAGSFDDVTPEQLGSEGGNFAFSDGSVKWLRQDELKSFRVTMRAGSKIRGYLPVVK